jgi:3-oxoadipate enol-lactonase
MKYAVLILFLFASWMAEARSSKSGFIKAKTLTIYYETTGSGSPVFFLHAGLQDHHMWDAQVKTLARKHQVITLDLPAHGRTLGWDTTFLMADILSVVMDSLKLSKAAFVGLSFGAVCVTDLLLKYPKRVSKAVLAAPGLLGWDNVITIDPVSKPLMDSLDAVFKGTDVIAQAEVFTRIWCDGPFRTKRQVAPQTREYIYNTTVKTIREHSDDYWPRFYFKDAADRVGKIQSPVLIISSDKDVPLITDVCKYLNQKIKTSKLVTIPNAAHMVNLEQETAFNKVLMEFL